MGESAMSWLLIFGLKNTLLALPLAALAFAAARWGKRPALAHLLWALVLVKLVTPPLIDVPVGWRLNVESWVGARSSDAGPSIGDGVANVAAPKPQLPAVAAVANERQRSVAVHRRLRPGTRERDAGASAAWSPASPAVEAPQSFFHRFTFLETWLFVAGAVWIAGSLGTLAMMLYCGWRFRRFVQSAAQRDQGLAARVGELAVQSGVRLPPQVVAVDGVVSPMLWGLGQNVRIVFPARLAGRLTPAALDSLLLHELAHYSRGDQWVRGLELAACVVYWWNPLLWLALRGIEAAEEQCCDAWVIQRQRGSPRSYAEALLATIDFLCEEPAPLPPAACGLGQVSLLKIRLTQIMRGHAAARLSRTVQATVLMLGVVISPLEPALWATSTPQPPWRTAKPRETAPGDHVPPKPTKAPINIRRSTSATPLQTPGSAAAQADLPAVPRPAPAALWATAVSPNGRFRVEARTGLKTALVDRATQFRVDLSAYRMTCVAFSPDSATFASGHDDPAVVRVWDSATGGLIASLPGAEAPVTSLHISPDGRRLAAGAQDGSVLVWDLTTGQEVARLAWNAPAVSCVRWSRGSDRLAIGYGGWSDGEQASLAVWSPEEGAPTLELPLSQPAGAVEWLEQNDTLAIASWSGQTQVWSLNTSQPVWQMQLDKDVVSSAAWSPNCTLGIEWLDQPVSLRTDP
jgi:beta-lactamase regulating signal transducer with metallopeptidase domain